MGSTIQTYLVLTEVKFSISYKNNRVQKQISMNFPEKIGAFQSNQNQTAMQQMKVIKKMKKNEKK